MSGISRDGSAPNKIVHVNVYPSNWKRTKYLPGISLRDETTSPEQTAKSPNRNEPMQIHEAISFSSAKVAPVDETIRSLSSNQTDRIGLREEQHHSQRKRTPKYFSKISAFFRMNSSV